MQRIVLILLLVLFAATCFAKSMFKEGKPVFEPNTPSLHATWKGRATMNCTEARWLMNALVTYLGVHPNTVPFLLEIAAAESDFGYYVRQVKGPAQSAWQIEPATARDLHNRLPKRNFSLYQKIIALRDPTLDEEENVVTNLPYGAALCVGVLWLKGIHFETLDTLQKRAMAWKKYYNTYLGKGTLEGYCQKVKRHLGENFDPNEPFEEAFDQKLFASSENIFQARDNERYLVLPDDFDASPIGRYYLALLKEKPRVFEQVPAAILRSANVKAVMQNLTMELMRQVQKNPTLITAYFDMPKEILAPLIEVAMQENAVKAYPLLPEEYQSNPMYQRMYESQQQLIKLMQR